MIVNVDNTIKTEIYTQKFDIEQKEALWEVPFDSLPADFQHELIEMGYYSYIQNPHFFSNLWRYLLGKEERPSLEELSSLMILIQVDRHHNVQFRVDAPFDHPIISWER